MSASSVVTLKSGLTSFGSLKGKMGAYKSVKAIRAILYTMGLCSSG